MNKSDRLETLSKTMKGFFMKVLCEDIDLPEFDRMFTYNGKKTHNHICVLKMVFQTICLSLCHFHVQKQS